LKKDDESNFDYLIRLFEGKSEGIYDLDYSELFNLAFGVKLNSDECRKRFYGIKMILPYINKTELSNVDSSSVLDTLEKKKIELQLERKKLQTISIEYNKLLREEARYQLIFDELLSKTQLVEPPIFNIIPVHNNSVAGVLAFSDIHYSKIFESLTNTYSEEIVHQRMNKLLSEVINICQKENLSKLVIVNVGDSLDGLIHLNQLKTLQNNVVSSVVNFSRFMAEWLNELSKYIEIDYHQVISSNHTQIRPFNTKRNEFAEEDFELIIVNYIHDLLINNNRINVIIPKVNFIDFEICGFDFIVKHGHDIKNVSNALKDISNFHRKFYDFFITAHLHHADELTVAEGKNHNCEILLIPSVMGSDEFSDSLMVGSKSGAKLFLFEESKGKTISYNIILN